jgi:hypothetical protein
MVGLHVGCRGCSGDVNECAFLVLKEVQLTEIGALDRVRRHA